VGALKNKEQVGVLGEHRKKTRKHKKKTNRKRRKRRRAKEVDRKRIDTRGRSGKKSIILRRSSLKTVPMKKKPFEKGHVSGEDRKRAPSNGKRRPGVV